MLNFFETLLNMSITGAVIIAFVMIVRLFLKKLPRKYSYILWIIPAIRLLIPFSVAAPVSVFNFIHIPEPHAVISDSGEVNEPPALTDDIFTEPITDAVIGEVTDDGYLDSVPDGWYTGESVPQITGPVFTYDVITNPPLATDPIAAPEVTDAPNTDMPAAPVVSEVNTALTLWRAACAVWATGVIAMLCYLAYSFAATKRAVEHSYKIGEGLYSNGYIDTPFVFGYIKPRIYVPLGLDDKEFAYVVAHEKTHIKRCDHIIKAAASLILCVHWFNPFAWLAFKLMTVDMELSCDERAINTYDLDVRKDYARALLNMSVVSKKVPFHGMLSFGESSIKSRIKGILRMKKPAAWACVAAVCVIIVSAVCLLTNAEQTAPDPVGTDTTDPVETTDSVGTDITDPVGTTEPVDTNEPPVTAEPPITEDPVTAEPPVSSDGKEYDASGRVKKETVIENVDGKVHKTMHFYNYYTSEKAEDHITYFYINEVLQYVSKRLYYTSPVETLYMESMQYYNSDGSEGEYTFKRYTQGGMLVRERYYESGKPIEREYVYKDGVRSLIYTLEDAVKYWLATDSHVASPAKGGRNENQYSNLVIEYDPEYADDIAAQFRQGDVAEQHEITKDCDVRVVNAKFSGGGLSDNSILVVVVKGADGIFRGVSEVRVVQQTETGGVAMIGALNADGTLREYTLFDGRQSYTTYMLPSTLDVEIGDKVRVSYLKFAAMKAQLAVKVLSAECLEDKSAAVSMNEYTTKIAVKNSDDPKVPVNYSVPSNWQNYGIVFNRNNIVFFRMEDYIYPVENGIDVEGLKNYGDGILSEVNVIEEKPGTDNDPFAYYVYLSWPDAISRDGMTELHRYIVENNGYYVTVGFFGDAEIPAETVDAVIRSIKVGSPWDDSSVSIAPEGNIIYVRLSGGELFVNVDNFAFNDANYLKKFLEEYSYMPQSVITFPNKDVKFECSPATVSRKTEKFVLYNTCVNYTVVDGAIYTKDMETLVAFPPAVTGEYTLPESVKNIDDNALYGSKLSKLIVPFGTRTGKLYGAENVVVEEDSSTLKGTVSDVGELTADGTGRKCLLQISVLHFSFTAPSDMDIRVGDLVTVTFDGNAVSGFNRENVTLGVVSHESGDRTVTMAEKFIDLKHSSIGQTIRIEFAIPSAWSFNGGNAINRNGTKFMEISGLRTASEGIDPDRFKKLIEYDVEYDFTVFDEKYGTEDDPFAYYIHRSIGAKYTCDGTYDTYDYVIEDNGWYITFSFLCDADIPQEIVDEIVRSVRIGR